MADKTLKVTISAKDDASATFRKVGDSAMSLGEAMERASRGGRALVGMGAGLSAVFVAPMALGAKAAWSQVDAVQKATVALRGYEKDASKVDKVLRELVAYARSPEGVLFQRQDLFAAAQGLKVAGAETQNLTRYVEIMGRSVASGMTTWQDLTQILQRVGSTGQLTGIDFDNLTKAGFQLDESLRNQAVSWEQLFSSLDRGIPQMGDALNTIEGQTIRFQSALRNLGLAFLGIDRDTSEFLSAGLGDQLYQGIGQATEILNNMQPAAAAAGEALGMLGTIAGGAVSAFMVLPPELQATIGFMGGLTGVTMTAAGAFLMLLPRIVATRQALSDIGGARGFLQILGQIAGTGPATIGAMGVAAGVAAYGFYRMWKNVTDLKDGITSLNHIALDLRLEGLDESADLLQKFRNEYTDLAKYMADTGSIFTSGFKIPNDVQARFTEVLGVAFTDARIDAQAFFDWFMENVNRLKEANDYEGLAQFLSDIDLNTLEQFKVGVDSATSALDDAAVAAENARMAVADFIAAFADFPAALDDLRLDGKGALARQFEVMHRDMMRAFTPTQRDIAAFQQAFMELGLPQDAWEAGMTPLRELTETQLSSLESAWNRTMQGMSAGTLDNAAVMTAWQAIVNDTTLTTEEQIAALVGLSTSLSAFYDSAKAMQQGQLDFLGDGSRILDWWREYDRQLTKGIRVTGQSNAALVQSREAFRAMVDWAGDIGQAGAALDQALRTFQEIDALGQRSSSAGSIAENLVGKPGEWAAIDDMLQAGTISLEKYNEAVTAGHAIQESDARVQSLLNQIRRDQLPLLAEQQQAYEDNLQYLSGLNAEEQRRALMLQDSSVQAQIATLYNTAYAASLGEIPEEVATEMILEAANADAGLKSILLQLGLLRENADGTISVVFPDADATVSAINRVTIAILAMQAVAENKTTYQIAVELYGEEEAKDILGYWEDEAGKRHYIKIETQVTGTGDLQTAANDLKEITLADGTVVTVKTDVDTTGWDQLSASELASKFENDPVQIPVEGVIKPMDGVTPEEWNNMIGPFPEIEIPASVKPEFDWSTLGDKLNPWGGGTAGVEIPVTANTEQATSDISAVAAAEIPAKTAVILGDNAGAMSAIDATNLRNVDDKTLAIGGDNDSAMSAISAVNNTAVNDKYMTIYATTVYSSIGTPGLGLRHGGIAGYAHGGIPVELAEAGTELLHFASGGTMPIYNHGYYTVPPMTYVSPANTGTAGGRGDVYIDFSGATFVGTSRAEMDNWAETSLVPNLRKVLQDERAGYPR